MWDVSSLDSLQLVCILLFNEKVKRSLAQIEGDMKWKWRKSWSWHLKGFYFIIAFSFPKGPFLFDDVQNEVFQFLIFPGLGFHMPHYKAMIYSFLSFLGLKDFLNLTRMSWTILSWSYAITWSGNTRMPLKKQEGQITVLPDFLRYGSPRLQFWASLHGLRWELLCPLINLW